jgi:branched-chain amino acid transport system permease protein
MLFLLAAGLTLVFGSWTRSTSRTGHSPWSARSCRNLRRADRSFWLAVRRDGRHGDRRHAARVSVLRRSTRDHLSRVLATFAIILIANELVRIAWGRRCR